MGHPTSFCPLPPFPLQFHSEALTRALSLARPVGNIPPRARPFSLQLSRGFLSTRQESCARSEGPGGFGLRAAWQQALELQEGSHLAGPGCRGNQAHNIPLPARDRGHPSWEGGSEVPGQPGREHALPISERALTPNLNWGAVRRRWVPRCAVPGQASSWLGGIGCLYRGCTLSCLFKRIIIGHLLFARSGAEC